jgi:VCBS repeat-containing protein
MTGVNDAPTAHDDAAVVDLAQLARTGSPQTIAVLLNDDDIDSDDSRSTLHIVQATSASGAAVSISEPGDGSGPVLLYDPRNILAAQQLSLGQTLPAADTITYTIADRWGATADAHVAVTWVGANDAPTAGADTVVVHEGDAPTAVDVLANDDDVDSDDSSATLHIVAATAEQGTAAVSADGHHLVIAPGAAYPGLAEGEQMTYAVTYTIADQHGATANGHVDVVVVGVNDAPIAADDTITGSENTNITGNVLANNGGGADHDVDGDALRVDTTPLAGPAHGSLTLNADGTFVYTPDHGFAGNDAFTYQLTDRPTGGLSNSATVHLLVGETNDAPVASDDAAHTDENTAVTITVLANDSDADSGDVLRPIAIAGVAIGVGEQVTLASGAVATLGDDGSIHYDPKDAFAALGAGEHAVDNFSYTVGDGHGGTAEADVAVTVDGRNDAPVAGTDLFSLGAGNHFSVDTTQLLANDVDVDRGDVLTVTAVDASGTHGVVAFDGTTVTYDTAGRFQALGAGETALDVVHYTLQDSAGATASGEMQITVVGVNDPPQATDDTARTPEDRAVVIDVLGNDADPDTGDHVSIVGFDTTGTLGQVSLNPDGTVTYNPDGHFDGLAAGETATDHFRYVIADGSGAHDTADVTVTISGKNSVEQLVDSFEQPFRISDLSYGASDTVGIKTQYVETDGAHGTDTPTDGSHLAWLEAYGTTQANLDTFLGVDLRANFTDLDGSTPASGAAFHLDVKLQAGDELSFDWLFDARDTVKANPADNDFAVVTITDADGTDVFKLSDVRQTGDNGSSGWQSTVYTAAHSGTVTVAIGVVNDRASDLPVASDPHSENSALLVDNMRINRDFSDGYQVVDSSADGKFETVAHQQAHA